MIESGRYAVLVQKSRDRFGLFPRADIDDARAGHASDDAQQLTVLVLGTPYDIAQVRPLETHAADVRLAELQAAHDVLGDLGVAEAVSARTGTSGCSSRSRAIRR